MFTNKGLRGRITKENNKSGPTGPCEEVAFILKYKGWERAYTLGIQEKALWTGGIK